MPFRFGISDVLEVDYWLRDGKVRITISIIPSIERALPERTPVDYLKSIPWGIWNFSYPGGTSKRSSG